MEQLMGRRLEKEEGLALARKFLNSGLKVTRFCRKERVSAHKLRYWRACLERAEGSDRPKEFLPVHQIRTQSDDSTLKPRIKIYVGSELSIEIPEGFDRILLKEVLEVCRVANR